MSRWKAASAHLSISIIIGIAAALLVFGIWYPQPFTQVAGGEKLILVLLGVDLVIGPLLTLIVYRHGKRGMAFDLAAIALMQSGALAYGLAVVAQARPVFIVGAVDRLVVVSADALEDADLAAASTEEFRYRSWTGPRMANAQLPTDSATISDLAFSGLAGKDLERFPRYYANYSTNVTPLLAKARPLEDLHQQPESMTTINQWVQDHGYTASELRWLPIIGRGGDFTAILNARDGHVVGVVSIRPW